MYVLDCDNLSCDSHSVSDEHLRAVVFYIILSYSNFVGMGVFPFVDWLARKYHEKGKESTHWPDYLKVTDLSPYNNWCIFSKIIIID